jgi:AraC-like DNA-binding protein
MTPADSHSTERLTTDALDPISALVVHAASLREAMSSIQEFRRLLGDEASFRVYEEGEKVIIKHNSLPGESLRVRRFIAEIASAGLFRSIRRFCTRADANIDYVAFEYSAPDYASEYARIFEGRARFDEAFTGLCFDSQLMTAAAPHPDPELHQALRVYAGHRTLHLHDHLSYAARVHQHLVWQPPPRDMSMQAAARALSISVRSLRRHLTAEGKSYASLASEALATIARTCLRDERHTILETALELGFADNTGFHRAFKRWTGLTPTEYRRQQKSLASRA